MAEARAGPKPTLFRLRSGCDEFGGKRSRLSLHIDANRTEIRASAEP